MTVHTAPASWRPSTVHVDLDAIGHNVRRIRDVVGPDASVCAVVKADAYGHGAVPVARAATDAGAAWLAVALVEEGVELRRAGLDGPVLLLTEPPAAAIDAMVAHDLTPLVYSPRVVALLDAYGRDADRAITVHLKADTGMGRVGATPEEWDSLLAGVGSASRVRVDGIATHLARADEPGASTTDEQLAVFDRLVERAHDAGICPTHVHAANSAGALLHTAARHTMVRAGIGIYGLSPSRDVDAADHGLRPALSLTTEVSHVKRVTAGTPVSYGHRWHAPHDGWLATLPVGYADGVPRALTNRAEVLFAGGRHPVAGTVTMDQVLVWCDQTEPSLGQTVTLIGADGGEQVRVEDWAEISDTITYEIVTQLTHRLPRVHTGGPR